MNHVADVDGLAKRADELWWGGRADEYVRVVETIYEARLAQGQLAEAAMVALEAAVTSFLRGHEAQGSGWMGRAHRLVEELPESAVHGYVCYVMEVEGGLGGGDLEGVITAAEEVRRIGREHGDENLVAGGLVGEGRARLKLGAVAEGAPLLDEAMVAVLQENLDPEWAGNIYCHLMAACHEIADIGRAGEWTEATARWLSDLPAAVLFTGICRVHRSQVLQLRGEWTRAETEAETVCADLADLSIATVAEAHYQLGEIGRLRGDLGAAEAAYQQARERGRDPQPGLALLRLAQGRADIAVAGIGVAVRGAPDRITRARLSGAQVEIAIATGDLETAQMACADLESAADAYGTSGLEAAALHWRGALMLEQGRPDEALPALRAACRRWHDVHARYDAARACVLLARAYREVGDEDAAGSELASAERCFRWLGADLDLREATALASMQPGRQDIPGGLTAREAHVLALVATGGTNRDVAEMLTLSEKTIERHLSNIFAKLDVSTRTEAAAFAYRHDMTRRATRYRQEHG